MDGFASYNAPLTDGNFKITYAAKSPEVIIADTKILAAAPSELKSAGFGDMVGKYVGLIDWQVSALITGEYYCEKVANLTRSATDRIMALADRVTATDEESAAAVFEALLLTGIGMGFTKTSRPASGTEHILSHFWECKKLLDGKLSDFHGKKVGVATLMVMEEYQKLIEKESVKAHAEVIDWEDVYAHYGALKEEVVKLNTPDTITDGIDPRKIEENWGKIREIVLSMPTLEEIKSAMDKAGAVTTASEIAVSDELRDEGFKYHPYMRRRLSLLRLSKMIEK
jgi:glycerol-1-phosphate dehydrogenase [NAD(P)+]